MSSGCFKANCIAKSKYVIVGLVLQSVLVYVNTTGLVSNTSVNQELMRFARRVDARCVEVLLDHGAGIDVLENSDLSLMMVSFHFKHLPSKHHINAALVALFQGNFISIWESVNFLVRGPVLDAGVIGGAAVKLVLSHKVLVVKGVKISTFAFVWELW